LPTLERAIITACIPTFTLTDWTALPKSFESACRSAFTAAERPTFETTFETTHGATL
jgi:hypothetical protein